LAVGVSNKRQIHTFNFAPTEAKRMNHFIDLSFAQFPFLAFLSPAPGCHELCSQQVKELFITESALLQLHWQTWRNAKEDLSVCLQMSSERYN